MKTDIKPIVQKAIESGAIKLSPKKKRDYKSKKPFIPSPTVIHGKNHTYVTHNCRCELCAEAHRIYNREYRERTEKKVYKRKNPWYYKI